MPSASEILFAEAGLDVWGHPSDYRPPEPPSKSEIAKLRARYDKLEHEAACKILFLSCEEWETIAHRKHVAKLAYADAITARNRYLRWKAQTSTRRVKAQERKPLEDAMFKAERHLDTLIALGSDFYTHREFTDANAAFTLASDLHDIAEKKFDIQEREARADKRAGIVRFRASRVRRN
jgi:hypothetical protein